MWWSVWHQAGFLRMNSNRKCHQFPRSQLWKLFTAITLRFFVLFFVSDSSRAASVSMMLTAVTTRRTAADSSLHKSKTSCNNWLICDKWLSAFLYKSGFLMVVIESFFLFMFLFVLCLFLSLISDSAGFYFTSCSRLFQRHKSVCILTQTRLPSSSLNFLITC